VVQTVGHAVGKAWLVRIGEEMTHTLVPTVHIGPYLSGQWSTWPEAVAYLSSVTLLLALAIVAVNRRELSYAAD
jgi:hypothetical protein